LLPFHNSRETVFVYFKKNDFESKTGHQGHLDLTHSLDGLGLTMNNPQIVLVPPEGADSTGKAPSQDPEVNVCILELFLLC
jgi:hypothetical protein